MMFAVPIVSRSPLVLNAPQACSGLEFLFLLQRGVVAVYFAHERPQEARVRLQPGARWPPRWQKRGQALGCIFARTPPGVLGEEFGHVFVVVQVCCFGHIEEAC